jgi:UDP-N-acetylglucosamine 2-epimerase
MKFVNIVGARPQFIKLAPLERAIAEFNNGDGEPIDSTIVHTGQHYDAGMSDIFFDELNIPRAHFHLDIGSGRHGDQTARMLKAIENLLLDTTPDLVVTFGDTNSTLAGVLAASKLHIPVAHVEAGLRSFNRRMPEEVNRLVADHVSDLLLAPTPTAIRNLENENLASRTVFTGDIMYDAVLFNREFAKRKSRILDELQLEPKTYGLVTIHRASNTDENERLDILLHALNEVARTRLPLVFPVHPRTANSLKLKGGNWLAHSTIQLVEPLGYLDMLALLDAAKITLTDSGGLQKEAFFVGCPCITLRDETEWVETVEAGGNVLTGAEPEKIFAAVDQWQQHEAGTNSGFSKEASRYFGDGHAAHAILDALCRFTDRANE